MLACAVPLQHGGVVLHEGSLVHGFHPTMHVLLGVSTEEVRSHPTVLRLRANHRVPIVNVRAHARVAGLWEEK